MGVTLMVHASRLDPGAREQIESIVRHPVIEGPVAIMPDAHQGAGCVIGFTGRFRDGVIPNIVGVDIGCGVLLHPLPGIREPDFQRLDDFIRRIVPLGMTSHRSPRELDRIPLPTPLRERAHTLCEEIERDFYGTTGSGGHTHPLLQIGTLGGGNHFIEIDADREGTIHLTIHTGSRNLGKRIADHFQARAAAITRKLGVKVPKGQEFLPIREGGNDYLHWMERAQEYARLNRRAIAAAILSFFGLRLDESLIIESVHNYISERDRIIRKGAISAHSGERVVIPLTMADGVLLGIGRGNRDYNLSAPHGAGRLHGRKEMFRMLGRGEVTLQEYRETMKGIFSTSISRETIDESRFAYKPLAQIEPHLHETVVITDHLVPRYNLKAAGE